MWRIRRRWRRRWWGWAAGRPCCDRESGPGVVAVAGAGGETWLSHFDLQGVVLVAKISRRRVEGQLVVGRGVCHAAFEKAGDIVAGAEDQAAALHGKHLQREVAKLDLTGFGHGLEEALVIVRALNILTGAQGIDAVQSDAAAAKQRRGCGDLRVKLLHLLAVEFHHGAGERSEERRVGKECRSRWW